MNEQGDVALEHLRGEMKEGFAQMRGDFRALAAEVKASNEARVSAENESRRAWENLSQKDEDLSRRLKSLEDWRTAQETAAKVAPVKLTWGRVFDDGKTWVLAILGGLVAYLTITNKR